MSEIKVLTDGLQFAEGPVALSDGGALVTDIRGETVFRVAPNGKKTPLSRAGGGPNGLAVGPDGFVYVCNNGGNAYIPGRALPVGPSAGYKGGYIQRVDPKTGDTKTLYSECDGRPIASPNDLVFDRAGGFYFTDIGKRRGRERGYGCLYYAKPDGSSIRELTGEFFTANGVGLSPDDKVVYVAETETARLWAFDIAAPGEIETKKQAIPTPTGARLVYSSPRYERFDSLAVDAAGNICVAALDTACILVISPAGEVVREVKVGDPHVTNIAFGGDDMRTAYITLSGYGQLATMRWPDAGLKLHFNL